MQYMPLPSIEYGDPRGVCLFNLLFEPSPGAWHKLEKLDAEMCSRCFGDGRGDIKIQYWSVCTIRRRKWAPANLCMYRFIGALSPFLHISRDMSRDVKVSRCIWMTSPSALSQDTKLKLSGFSVSWSGISQSTALVRSSISCAVLFIDPKKPNAGAGRDFSVVLPRTLHCYICWRAPECRPHVERLLSNANAILGRGNEGRRFWQSLKT